MVLVSCVGFFLFGVFLVRIVVFGSVNFIDSDVSFFWSFKN